MKFTVHENSLSIGAKKVSFPSTIKQIELFNDIVIVITDYTESPCNENVWGVNDQGEVVWQVEKVDKIEYEGIEYIGITEPYSGIHKVDDKTARIFNLEGGYFEINPTTGAFIKNIIQFRKGKRPW